MFWLRNKKKNITLLTKGLCMSIKAQLSSEPILMSIFIYESSECCGETAQMVMPVSFFHEHVQVYTKIS